MKRRFFFQLSLFIVPSALYVLLTIGLPWYAGEFIPVDQVAAMQMGAEPILYGRAYRGNTYPYKLAATRLRQPEVLVVGSSRVLQFRAEFFNENPSAFYNAGGTTSDVAHFRGFLERLTVKPKILIVSLDQVFFSPYVSPRPDAVPTEDLTMLRVLNISREVFQDLLEQKIDVNAIFTHTDPLYRNRTLGFSAAILGDGFRNDGSYQYGGRILQGTTASSLVDTDLIDDNENLIGGDEVNGVSLVELTALLEYCRDQDIYLIAFSPPFAPSIYDEMMRRGTHQYIPMMAAEFSALFQDYGYAYFDFADAATLGASDDDMVDSFHGSERVYFRMYMKMLEALPEILGEYSDLETLRAIDQHPPSKYRWEIFPYPYTSSVTKLP